MRQKGQSLVETVIILPIFIMMLFAVFEIGWAIRNYMIVLQASREAARATIRPQYWQPDPFDPGFDAIYDHIYIELGNNLPEFDRRGTTFISVAKIETGMPCATEPEENWLTNADGGIADYWPHCDCDNPATLKTDDQVIIYPGNAEYPAAYTFKQPQLSGYDAGFVMDAAFVAQAALDNEIHNCNLLKNTRGAFLPQDNSMVVAEVVYENYHLFGFPFIANRFTNPIVLRAYTVMRIPDNVRDPATLEHLQFKSGQ
jgi:hypothetical protein